MSKCTVQNIRSEACYMIATSFFVSNNENVIELRHIKLSLDLNVTQ